MQEKSDDSKAEYELEAFFRTLTQSSSSIQGHFIEKLFIEFGLRYLLAESKTSRHRRDHATVKRVWLVLHPYLERHKMLDQFRGNEKLKGSLTFFIKNGFGL